MKNSIRVIAIAAALAAVAPACTTARVYGSPVHRPAARAAFDEGFSRGLIDGRRAARLDLNRSHPRSFWNDPRYRRGTEGYRSRFGSRAAYANGFRAGYERGYDEELDWNRGHHHRRHE